MASNQDIKKPQRKADEDVPERLCKRGKQPFQKYKAYVVLQYLLKYHDEKIRRQSNGYMQMRRAI